MHPLSHVSRIEAQDSRQRHWGELPNFASFLRVASMRYLRRCMLALERQQAQPVPALTALSDVGWLAAFVTMSKGLAAAGR